MVAEIPYGFCCRSEHHLIVVGHKDRLTSTAHLRERDGQLVGVPLCFNRFGQIQLDRGAAAGFAVNADVPARFLGKAVNLRQTETRSLSDLLRREERFEDVRQYGCAEDDALL